MQVALFNLMNANRPEDTTAELLGNARELTVAAEALGFDAAWFAEHHFSSQSVCCSPLLMAAHCAAATRRILLGPAVLVLPFYEPLRVVQEIAMLDALSGGRTLLGFGAGHQPHEFRSFGIPIADRAAMLVESWDIVVQALTTGRVAHAGAHHRIDTTELAIRPLRAGMPPLFVASGDPATLELAARRGATAFIAQGHRTAEEARPMRAKVAAAFAAAGRTGPVPLAVQRYAFPTTDRDEARVAAAGLLDVIRKTAALRTEHPAREPGGFLRSVPIGGEPTVEWLLEHAPIGDPDRCAAILAADSRALGTTHLSLYTGFAPVPLERQMRALRHLGDTALPALRAIAPTAPVDAAAAAG